MDKVLYKKVCLGIVLLLLSGEFTAQTLKYVDAQKLLMVGKAQPNTEYYHRIIRLCIKICLQRLNISLHSHVD